MDLYLCENVHGLVQDLNSGHRVHFLRRYPLHHERLTLFSARRNDYTVIFKIFFLIKKKNIGRLLFFINLKIREMINFKFKTFLPLLALSLSLSLSLSHTHTYTHTLSHFLSFFLSVSLAPFLIPTYLVLSLSLYIYIYIYTHAYMRGHTHTHTHTYIYNNICYFLISFFFLRTRS